MSQADNDRIDELMRTVAPAPLRVEDRQEQIFYKELGAGNNRTIPVPPRANENPLLIPRKEGGADSATQTTVRGVVIVAGSAAATTFTVLTVPT